MKLFQIRNVHTYHKIRSIKMYKGTISLFLILMFLIFSGCEKENTKEEIKEPVQDATSSATQQADQWLPEDDLTYNIVGYKKGLKGCTIEYNKTMYRGGNILSTEGAKVLQEKGIKTVISVTPDDNINTICNTFGLNQIDMYYDYGKLSDSTINSFLNVLDSAETPLYIHCFSGKQRAGLLCAISRIYKEDWSFENAELEYGKLGGKVEEDRPLLVRANEIIKSRKG